MVGRLKNTLKAELEALKAGQPMPADGDTPKVSCISISLVDADTDFCSRPHPRRLLLLASARARKTAPRPTVMLRAAQRSAVVPRRLLSLSLWLPRMRRRQ